jgi:hypothetical protein
VSASFRPAPLALSLFGVVSVVVACAGGKPATTDSATSASAAAATPPVAANAPAEGALRPGDVRITTPNNAVVLALMGDSVWMGLSDSVLTQARLATDSARTKAAAANKGGIGGAFGAMIAEKVTAAVDAGLKTRVAYPLSDIQDVTYQDGAIHFTYRSGAKHALSFEDIKTGENNESHPVLSTFAPADAERFVATVRARSGGRMTFPPKSTDKP